MGKTRYQREKKSGGTDESGSSSDAQRRHRDRDAGFSVKNGQVHYGYKSHIKVDVDHHLVRSLAVTPANVHDSDIDLVTEGDYAAYRDKGYFGKPVHAPDVVDKTRCRSVRGRRLNGGQQKRNRVIGRIRSPGERPFSVVKRVFKGERTMVKTRERVQVKEMFKWFGYNLYQLVTLERKRLAVAR